MLTKISNENNVESDETINEQKQWRENWITTQLLNLVVIIQYVIRANDE
jgi:hypothetical protein